MNKIGRDFNSDIVINNINHILKSNYIELPHKDTLINVISSINFEELEEILAHAKVISDHEIQTDTVNVGITVVLYDMEYDEDVEYTIVSSREVNLAQGKISDQSPIGRALVGAKVGDTVSVEVPDGIMKYKVKSLKRQEN